LVTTRQKKKYPGNPGLPEIADPSHTPNCIWKAFGASSLLAMALYSFFLFFHFGKSIQAVGKSSVLINAPENDPRAVVQ